MDLKNRWGLITGSARRVGKAIALELAKNGVNIYLHYGNAKEAAKATKNEIKDFGVEVIDIKSNLSSENGVTKLFDPIIKNKKLDFLVNSAATFQKKDVENVTLTDWDHVMNVNLRAPFFISQQARRLMSKNNGIEKGVIVNISDLSGIYPWAGYTHHGISKAGLIQLTKSIAYEFSPDIRVNAIIPGPILPPPGMDVESTSWKQMTESLPLKRGGNPLDIAKTVIMLIENSYITGTCIFVDGGEHLIGNKNHQN